MLQMFYEFLSHSDSVSLEGGDEERGNIVSVIQGYLDYIIKCS